MAKGNNISVVKMNLCQLVLTANSEVFYEVYFCALCLFIFSSLRNMAKYLCVALADILLFGFESLCPVQPSTLNLAVTRRLKSIKNIQKITKSMKMVSAAKYARAERELKPARVYGTGALCERNFLHLVTGQQKRRFSQ